jgi:1,2-diacylglycerol 3-alpha-glucosyltransferase
MSGVSIGLFNDSFVPVIDGVTVTVRNYAYWLNKTLGPTCVVAPSAPFHREDEGFPVLRFLSMPTVVHPPYRIGLPSLDLKLCGRLRRSEFSLVHAHSPFGAGRAALKVARKKGVPIVATFHSKFRENLELAIPIKRIVDEQIKRIVGFYESVDQVWVPQASVIPTLREYGYDGPCEVVENGIDFSPPDDISHLRARGGSILGVPDDAPVGLFVGQMILEKNLEFLLRSIPGILAAVPKFRMAFVGQGCGMPRLRALALGLGLGDRVRFHGPIYDRGLLAAVYARGDLFLFPSLWDNAPLVVREAAAFRTPSLLLRDSTAAEVIRDGVNGFLADGRDEAFAETAVKILGNPLGLEIAGLGAQRSLCRSWEDVVLEVKARYLSILSRRPARYESRMQFVNRRRTYAAERI